MPNAQPLFIVISAALALFLVLSLAVLYFRYQRSSSKYIYDDQLNELIDYNEEEAGKTKVTLITRWNRYWYNIFSDLGMKGYNSSEAVAGRNVALAMLLVFGVLYYVFKSLPAALAITLIGTYAISSGLRTRANKKNDEISAQLPGFLFALKANIQAQETPERAILKVVDSMPSPLHEDLTIVKQKLLANATFKEALTDLSARTSSRDLKFLCACMAQAASSGSSIEPQITAIQNALEERRRVSDEINTAVRSARPSMIMASVTIPGFFAYAMITDPNARSFWFVTPLSYAILGGVIALYLLGMWMVKKMVDGIRNL